MAGPDVAQHTLRIRTQARSFTDITPQVAALIQRERVQRGLCHLFLRHTSASLLLSENADPAVRRDLERFMGRVAPEDEALYEHDAEGPDDMPAHIRTMLAGSSLTLPIGAGELLLGTWQGVYLWEHRSAPHDREVVVTMLGA